MDMSIPFLSTRASRAQATWDYKYDGYCSKFELAAIECYESYGFGSPKCKDYMTDLTECIYRRKSIKRGVIMRDERKRQFREGTRSKENFYSPPPRHGSF